MPDAEAILKIENEAVRVTEWRFAPQATTRHHRHEYDYVVVPLTDGMLRILDKAGETAAALTFGAPYFRKAGVEHEVINDGDAPIAFVEIELKSGHPGTNPGSK